MGKKNCLKTNKKTVQTIRKNTAKKVGGKK